jgi:hypothetical protein
MLTIGTVIWGHLLKRLGNFDCPKVRPHSRSCRLVPYVHHDVVILLTLIMALMKRRLPYRGREIFSSSRTLRHPRRADNGSIDGEKAFRRTRFGTRETPPCQKAILLSKDIEGTLSRHIIGQWWGCSIDGIFNQDLRCGAPILKIAPQNSPTSFRYIDLILLNVPLLTPPTASLLQLVFYL